MAKKKSFFGNEIQPSCSYCLFGNRSKEGNKVLCEKKMRIDCSTLLINIDTLVYHLYGLTYDEVLIVDPNTPITEEEYNNEM